MSVLLYGTTIHLTGACRVEDAEPLLSMLQCVANRAVDLSAVEDLHAAVLQVLLVCRPKILGAPADPFVLTWLMPLLGGGGVP